MRVKPLIMEHEVWAGDGLELSGHAGVVLEIGPGRGDFLFHTATEMPAQVFVAIELKKKRFEKLIARAKKRGLSNVIIIKDYAQNVSKHLAPRTLKEVHIQFPDPWPKRCHHLNRLIQTSFLDALAPICEKGAIVHFTTDDKNYAYFAAEKFSKHESFVSSFEPAVQKDPEGIFPTFFYDKWSTMGRNFYYQRYTVNT